MLLDLKSLGIPNAPETLDQIIKDGHLFHCMYLFRNKQELVATLVYAALVTHPTLDGVPQAGQSQEGLGVAEDWLATEEPKKVNSFCQVLELRQDYKSLFEIADARHDQDGYDPLIAMSVKSIAESNRWPQLITTDVIAERWDELEDELREKLFSNVIKESIKSYQLCEKLMAQGFKLEDAGLYSHVLNSTEDSFHNFVGWYSQGVLGLSKEEWLTQLRSQDGMANFLSALASKEPTFRLNSSFADALPEFAAKLVTAEEISDTLSIKSRMWQKSLPSELLAHLASQLLGIAARVPSEQDISEVFFEVFGDLMEPSPMSNDDRDHIKTIANRVVTRGEPLAIEWLKNKVNALREQNNPLLNTDDTFRRRIQDALASQDLDQNVRTFLNEIAIAVNVDIPKPEVDVEAPDKVLTEGESEDD